MMLQVVWSLEHHHPDRWRIEMRSNLIIGLVGTAVLSLFVLVPVLYLAATSGTVWLIGAIALSAGVLYGCYRATFHP
jgi:hypothetical protein